MRTLWDLYFLGNKNLHINNEDGTINEYHNISPYRVIKLMDLEDQKDKTLIKAKFVIDTLVLKLDNREDRRLLYSDDLTVAVCDNLFNVYFQKLFDTLINNDLSSDNVDAEISIATTNFKSIKFTTMYDKIKLYNLNQNNNE